MRLNYDKILRVFFFVVIIALIITNFRQCAKSDGKNKYYIDKLNARSQAEIQKRELHIEKLTLMIAFKEKLIQKVRMSIDSLEKVKNHIEYVYINKVNQINDFNSTQLENYWKDEIK